MIHLARYTAVAGVLLTASTSIAFAANNKGLLTQAATELMGENASCAPVSSNALRVLARSAKEFAQRCSKVVLKVANYASAMGNQVYDAKELAGFTGRYHSEELGTDLKLQAEDGVLVVRGRTRTLRYTPRFADFFSSDAGRSLELQRGKGGRVTGFALSAGGIRGIVYTRQP